MQFRILMYRMLLQIWRDSVSTKEIVQILIYQVWNLNKF